MTDANLLLRVLRLQQTVNELALARINRLEDRVIYLESVLEVVHSIARSDPQPSSDQLRPLKDLPLYPDKPEA